MSNEVAPLGQFEAPKDSPELNESKVKEAEQRSDAAESAAGKQAPAILNNAPAAMPSSVPATSQSKAAKAVAPKDAQSDTSIADSTDSDLIEKEWVDKAKAIVSSTQDDPYKQKNEMSKVKAEYIEKRFKKTVKTDDTVANK